MGSSADANIAYGYDLGTLEDFKAIQRRDGFPDLPWFNDEEDTGDGEDEIDFGTAVEQQLLAAAGFTETWSEENAGYFDRKTDNEKRIGVTLGFSGSHEYPGFILYARGSKRSVEWSDTMALDPNEISAPRDAWNTKLADALTALGITPIQEGPRWLVFPSYG